MIELQKLFDIKSGTPLYLNCLTQTNKGIPFVARGSKDNGIAAYVKPTDKHTPLASGIITVAPSGSVLEAFLQAAPFYTSSNQLCLIPKKGITLSDNEKLYYCLCIQANKFRYSFSRQAHRTLKSLKVPPPDNIPAWVHELSPLYLNGFKQAATTATPVHLNIERWQWFKLGDLFTIKSGKPLPAAKHTQGYTPIISSRACNNGLLGYIGLPPTHKGGTLTVNYGGCVGEAFFQAKPFWGSGDVNILYPRFPMTPLTGLFLATVIRQEHYRYSYARKCSVARLMRAKIRLPSNVDGSIDISYIENYIKCLACSSQI